jgi:paraquat-inducible protein B
MPMPDITVASPSTRRAIRVKTSPTAIGAFTLGAALLALAALVALGGGELFTRHMRAVAYFTDDLQGLSVGSPVDFHGVHVGRVSAIQIHLDVATMKPVIPVYIVFTTRFDVEDVKGKTGKALFLVREKRLRTAIGNGLHARLATQSLVTGQRFVELEFDPGAPSTFASADPSTIEIPTLPSDLTQLQNELTRLPIDKISEVTLRLLGDADRLLASPEIAALLRSLHDSSDSFGRVLNSAQADLRPLIANANETVTKARDTLATAQDALQEARTTLATGDRLMSHDLREALKAATGALQKAEKALADADSLVSANSPQRSDLDESLRNLTATSRSLRNFSEEVERRPNAILLGR